MKKQWFLDLSDREVWFGQWNEWDWAAHDHAGFKSAFETLRSEGCEGAKLLDILERIRGVEVVDQGASASPDDIRSIRAALEQGHHALRGLVEGSTLEDALFGEGPGPPKVVREDWRLLRFSQDDADAALRILRDLSGQLKKLQRGADRRRSRVRDQYRAILVRYVKRKTGKLHDRLVCDLLEVALAPPPEFIYTGKVEFKGSFEPKVKVDPDHAWAEVTVEAHRRWRSRNQRLIDNPPTLEAQWEQDLQSQAEERQKRAEPRTQKLWPSGGRLRTPKSAKSRKP